MNRLQAGMSAKTGINVVTAMEAYPLPSRDEAA